MDGKAMQVLMVEDSADDARLLLAELERKRFATLPQRVETRAESRLFLVAIVESSDDAICGPDLDRRIVSWNPVEACFSRRSGIVFARGIGPECAEIYQR